MLLTLALMLAALGIATLFSASHESPERVVSQVRHLAVALGAMWLIARMPIQLLMRSALPVYLAGLLLLIGVALFGDVVNGARRWLSVGGMRFQPSEMMKIAVPLMIAWYFHRNEANLRRREFIVAGLLVAVPAALIVRQPDLG
ncbi:MAG: rod shape-determining protein RodA, partial [Betaproteobacteria bacterium SG8_39]